MRGLTRRAVVGALVSVFLGGCFLWRSDEPRPVARPAFPPPIDAVIDGPLIWAEAHPSWGKAPLTVHFDVELLEDARIDAWAWDFGDDTGVVRRQLPRHTYERRGIYEARVWAREVSGRISMDAVTVRVGQ